MTDPTLDLAPALIRRLQAVLASVRPGLAVDGIPGDRTEAAALDVLQGVRLPDSARRSRFHLLTAAAQRILDREGHDPGAIDGLMGHNTAEALRAWEFATGHGRQEVIARTAFPNRPDPEDLLRQADCAEVYGQPGPEVEAQLAHAALPFPFRLDWDLGRTVTRARVHRLCAPALEAALAVVADHYGPAAMRALGLDRYAGGYMHRRMRGGRSWSMHAYGCAIDIYAGPNGLRARCPEALFCRPEYAAFLDIMQAHGWLPAIRLWGADAMHFQMARL
ncbi:M15 family metallopeptidase [Roseibacterium beibuensis]|uniref:M15 family metallopeptidase n=1 Tax=[Roseibacterium] beibuensis TaxID=1193142 RepID=A0ABP9LCF8_9RHOB|nr:M15 family metallopeptidase [Roseibacterium beibuensis]MCS6624330.1 M15 family metallopeptidase [Roseibacterium beibuensis]